MSKVIRQSFEYLALSDAPQAYPYPNGYSPLLPTPNGVIPASNGIYITDQYMSDLSATAGLGYGVLTVNGSTTLQNGVYKLTVPGIPSNSWMQVYTPANNIFCGLYTTNLTVYNSSTTLSSTTTLTAAVVPFAPNAITTIPQFFTTGNSGTLPVTLVGLTGTPSSFSINGVSSAIGPVYIVWWQDNQLLD